MNDRMLIHLTGPMMSFADTGYGQIRESGGFPGRSMVLGFVAGALGIERNSPELLDLHRHTRVHVAAVNQGARVVDYQTVLTAGYDDYDSARYRREGKPGKNPTLTWRSYHLGAHYIVCIECDSDLGKQIREALVAPIYVGYLGRRSCPPTTPLLPVETHQSHPVSALVHEVRKMFDEEEAGRHGLMRWIRQPRTRRRLEEEGIDVWYDGEVSPSDIPAIDFGECNLIEYGERRDILTALPRSFSSRTYTHLHIKEFLPPSKSADTLTNEEAFDAAP